MGIHRSELTDRLLKHKMCSDHRRSRDTIGHGVGVKAGAVGTGGNGCGVADHRRKLRGRVNGPYDVRTSCVLIFWSTCCRK
jgi:hypothetical protein